MKRYSTADIATLFGVSIRTIQRNLATLRDTLSQEHKEYDYMTVKLISIAFNYDFDDSETTDRRQETTAGDSYDRTEYFTEEEYQEFQKRLIEYPMLLDKISLLLQELEHNKKLLEMNIISHNNLINTIKERNFIEAKEKKLDQ